jgi:hypothetical protein
MSIKLNQQSLLARTKNEILKSQIIGARLQEIAIRTGNDILSAESHRIFKCADPVNLWYGTNMKDRHSASPAPYEMIGTYTKCESIFCPGCSRRKAYRNYKNALEIINSVRLKANEFY